MSNDIDNVNVCDGICKDEMFINSVCVSAFIYS